MKRKHVVIVYESIMIILVIISVFIVVSPSLNIGWVHTLTWSIFLVDVLVRFIRARKKWKYVKKRPFDILSIIPFEEMFLLARFSRFLYLFRYKNAIKKYLYRVDRLLYKISFLKMTILTILGNAIVSVILYFSSSKSFYDAFEFVFLNFFKFNHVVENDNLLVLSIVLKVVGVLYMGILLKYVLSFLKKYYDKWMNKRKKKKKELMDNQNC